MVLPVRPGGLEQRAQADLVRALGQHLQAELGDDAVLADQRHDVGQRADRRDLHEGRQPRRLPGPRAQSACTSFSATPTPARFLSG